MIELSKIAREFKLSPGFNRKLPLKSVLRTLKLKLRGEDAGIVDLGSECLVFCLDGIWEPLLKSHPELSGYYSVLVVMHDIASMGAQPLGLLDLIGYNDPSQLRSILAGIKRGIRKFGVSILGGHTSPDSNPCLAICGLGIVPKKFLVRSGSASPGDRLVLGVDLSGDFNPPEFDCWDSTSFRSSSVLRSQLASIRALAEEGLITAAKDVSNSGILGTAGMLAEASGLKLILDLDCIPKPENAPMERWLRSYLGMGFLVSCPGSNLEDAIQIFEEHFLKAAQIGEFRSGSGMWIRSGNRELRLLKGNEFGFRPS